METFTCITDRTSVLGKLSALSQPIISIVMTLLLRVTIPWMSQYEETSPLETDVANSVTVRSTCHSLIVVPGARVVLATSYEKYSFSIS